MTRLIRNRLALVLVVLLCLTMWPAVGRAQEDPAADQALTNRGLLVGPLRDYVTVDAGSTEEGKVSIANLTETPLDIQLSAEQFTVTDYSYNYRFEPLRNDWLKLEKDFVRLEPNKSVDIDYSLRVPPNAAGGGLYYTIFATTTFTSNSVTSQVQAASLLYVAVNGDLHKTSELPGSSSSRIVFGSSVKYKLDIHNSGNVHYFVNTFGELSSWLPVVGRREVAHLMLPETIRTIEGATPSPLLPGIYKYTYGYRVEGGEETIRNTYILYLPPWFLLILGGGWWLWRQGFFIKAKAFVRRFIKPTGF